MIKHDVTHGYMLYNNTKSEYEYISKKMNL